MIKSKRISTEAQANAASMADIAFLLLIFFMVTTTIVNDQGLDLQLPPYFEIPPKADVHDRNVFAILINSADKVLVENEPLASIDGLQDEIKAFILNNGQNTKWSDSPKEAIISIKTNRGTSQQAFITVLDEAKAAYYAIYAKELGLTPKQVRELNTSDPLFKKRYKRLKEEFPMNISIAEPQQY